MTAHPFKFGNALPKLGDKEATQNFVQGEQPPKILPRGTALNSGKPLFGNLEGLQGLKPPQPSQEEGKKEGQETSIFSSDAFG